MLHKVFWSTVALDALLFMVLLMLSLQSAGQNDGGREIALVFGVALPALVIGMSVLLYLYRPAPAWRALALLVVAGPGLLLAGAQARNAYIDHAVAQRRSGDGYFQEAAMQAMGQAVVRHEVAALRRLATGVDVDVNAVGEDGMRLITLAVERAAETERGTPADAKRARQDGRNVSGEVTARIAEETFAGHALHADLLRLQTLLAAPPTAKGGS